MKRFKCIHCLCVKIGWDNNLPFHIAKETREKITLVIDPGQEIILSHDEMEKICGKILPKGVKAKSLLPGKCLNTTHTHIIVEILKPVSGGFNDFSSYPPLIDMTKEMAIIQV